MDVITVLGLVITGFSAGLLGALLGLGGGVFIVPALVLIFNIPTLIAVGTSSVAVVATSTAGASQYVATRLVNIRLGLLLLISTAAAAVGASLLASYLPNRVLSGLFAIVMAYTGYSMLRRRASGSAAATTRAEATDDPLDLQDTHYDRATGKTETYTPRNLRQGMSISLLAGVNAGLLGVGGGIIQTPVMNLIMGIPMRVAAGTSNFMIGVTATSAAFVRYAHGDVNPLLAVPIALSVFLGARAGAWLIPRTPSSRLKQIFGWVALFIAVLMLLQAAGIYRQAGR
jgi:uncharacterized membrane protein YfcA